MQEKGFLIWNLLQRLKKLTGENELKGDKHKMVALNHLHSTMGYLKKNNSMIIIPKDIRNYGRGSVVNTKKGPL